MFNQLLKIGLFVTMGLWLKHRLRGLALLALLLVMSWVLHSEYLAYVERSGNTTYLEWSFIIKWALIFTGLACYYLLVEYRLGKNTNSNNTNATADDISPSMEDGFDFLRQKKSLDSEADRVLKAPDRRHD